MIMNHHPSPTDRLSDMSFLLSVTPNLDPYTQDFPQPMPFFNSQCWNKPLRQNKELYGKFVKFLIFFVISCKARVQIKIVVVVVVCQGLQFSAQQ